MKTICVFCAGAIAGMTATTVAYPFDIMRTQFTMQQNTKTFNSMYSFISHTAKTKGMSGFFNGLTPAVIGIAPYMGLNFALYDAFKNLAHRSDSFLPWHTYSSGGDNKSKGREKPAYTILKNSLSGAAAGGISKTLVYPLDTIKKRLQGQALRSSLGTSLSSLPHYTGFINCISSIYATEGLQGFYRGLTPTVLKSITATAITFTSYEFAKGHLLEKDIKINAQQ